MTSPIEERLQNALRDLADSYPPEALPPLKAPRRRFDLRLPLAVAATAAVAAGGLLIGHELQKPDPVINAAPPTASPDPSRVELSVYLCAKTSANPDCHQKRFTESERLTIAERLSEYPGLTVSYESDADAYARFRELFENSPGLLAGTRPGDIPASFRIQFTDPTAVPTVRAAIDELPGIDTIIEERAQRSFTPSPHPRQPTPR
ncbi:hypothetical protein GCM10027589_14900 [Actinocorallia lasiicapitis]